MSSSNLNPDQPETTDEQPQTASVGVQLRSAREQAGLTSDELARRLCMTPSKLEALEQDQLDRFPGSTYVRGYIRNICKELRIDETGPLAAFARQAPAEAPRAAQVPKGPVVGGSGSSGGSAFVPIVLVAAVVAAGGYWWMGQKNAPVAPQAQVADNAVVDAEPADELPDPQDFAVSSQGQLESELAEDFAPETDVQLADVADVVTESPEPEPEAAAEAVVPVQETVQQADPVVSEPQIAISEPSVPASTLQPVAEPPAPVAISGAALALSFSEESWVEVTDATGNKILARLQPAGSTVELEGEAPFSLMLGNAAATTVSYAGEVVESAPLGNRRTRKLTVGG
ncbi:RodZ domain-containing protein [uncultured Microbulbifer sp.]|uniref:RodZ domain-containing protein n=1 Tax=uncultured Microbulbifer sp. TaxID=348147 RepID=UPI00262AEBCE|nr:RodZ domain-containing protein [uncultured Microbulbifer sp.]